MKKKKIAIFENILGFDRNTTKSEIIKRLGKPTHYDHDNNYDFDTMFYGEYLSFVYYQNTEKLKVVHINPYGAYLEETLLFLKKKSMNDEKINLLNVHKDKITQEFGKPSMILSDHYIYRTKDFQVTFACYDHNQFLCATFSVQFFEY